MAEGRAEGTEADLRPWLGAFGSAMAIWLTTQLSLWACERGLIGPRDVGQQILLRLPLTAVRAASILAFVVALCSGHVLLSDLRQRWYRYTELVLDETFT